MRALWFDRELSVTYNESSIKVLGEQVADERFDFRRVATLAKRYPWVTEEAISRLIEACTLSGWDIHEAEARYLRQETRTAPPVEFVEAYRELALKSVDRG